MLTHRFQGLQSGLNSALESGHLEAQVLGDGVGHLVVELTQARVVAEEAAEVRHDVGAQEGAALDQVTTDDLHVQGGLRDAATTTRHLAVGLHHKVVGGRILGVHVEAASCRI